MSASSEQQARTVRLPEGVDLHARPAGVLVRAAAEYVSAITLRAGEREADAKSILQVMALGATGGSELAVEATGEDASAALDAIARVLATLA
jgi:phosphocarrier protein HPr